MERGGLSYEEIVKKSICKSSKAGNSLNNDSLLTICPTSTKQTLAVSLGKVTLPDKKTLLNQM